MKYNCYITKVYIVVIFYLHYAQKIIIVKNVLLLIKKICMYTKNHKYIMSNFLLFVWYIVVSDVYYKYI